LTVQCLKRALDALVDLLEAVLALVRSAVVRFGVDRFARAAVNGDAFPRDEVQLLAQQRARTVDLPQRLQVVLPAARYRLVIRPQRLSQPHYLHIPVGLLCQATTRPETGERAINGELQQIRWVRGRPSRGCGCGALKAERDAVEVVDKGVDKTDGYSTENSPAIFMRGGEPWVMNYCWPTPKYRNWCAQHAFVEGKKAEQTSRRKSTPRTLNEVG